MLEQSGSQHSAERVIRVFISSTFRDMQAERDYLVKFIFPQLRNLCEHRGVVWGEVDLRWGVTDEQRAENKVLPICLEEIKRCRPYFIGLLGERYGWVPDTIPEDLIDREPWLQEHLHRAVTELEIVHGVLRQEQMHGHAYFYFRDSRCAEALPEDKKKDFTAESAESAEKLGKLKDRLRRARDEEVCRLRENYRDPKELGQWILEDFTQLINTLFPEGSQPELLDREAMYHDTYARSRARVYVGRQEYFDRLDAHAAANDGTPLVILGESGSGKSALLANWALGYRQRHPEELVIEHYIGASPSSADWAAMLRRVMGEFKRRFGIQNEIPETPDALRGAFPNWLYMAAAKGRAVVILDALNQLEDRNGAPDLVWLPPVMPSKMRLIVSTLPGRPLAEIKKRDWPALEVKPLDADSKKKFIVSYLKQYTKELNSSRVDRIAMAEQASNPLYLRGILEELRLFGEHDRLDECITHYLHAKTIPALYEKLLARYENDYEQERPGLVRDALAAIYASRNGLTESELMQLLGADSEPLPHAVWAPLHNALDNHLADRGGLLNYSHDFLRKSVQCRYLGSDVEIIKTHQKLAAFFSSAGDSKRRFDEFPWQLMRAREWQQLYKSMSNTDFLLSLSGNNHFDVNLYWSQIEANSAFRAVDAYREPIGHPQAEKYSNLKAVARVLGELGYAEEELSLIQFLADNASTMEQMPAELKLASLKLARGCANEAFKIIDNIICRCRRGLRAGTVLAAVDSSQQGAETAEYLDKYFAHVFADALHTRGTIYFDGGKYDLALADIMESEKICRAIGDTEGLQLNLGELALIYTKMGEFNDALRILQEKEKICRETENMIGLQNALGYRARIKAKKGNLYEAKSLLVERDRICSELGLRKQLLETISVRLQLALQEKRYEEVSLQYQRFEEIAWDMGRYDDLLNVRKDLVRSLSGQNKTELVKTLLGRIADHDCAKSRENEARKVCELLAEEFFEEGNAEAALAVLSCTELLFRRLGRHEDLEQCLANIALMQLLQGRNEEALSALREKAGLASKLGKFEEHLLLMDQMINDCRLRGVADSVKMLVEEKQRVQRERIG